MSKKKNKEKGSCLIYFGIVAFLSIVVCTICFFISFSIFHDEVKEEDNPETDFSSNYDFNENNGGSPGILRKIEKNYITVYDLNQDKEIRLELTDDTEYFDKKKNTINKADFEEQEIISYKQTNNVLESLSINKDKFEFDDVDLTEINLESNQLKYEGKNYTFNNSVNITYKGESMDKLKLLSAKSAEITGLNKTIWFIDVNKLISTLKLNNKDFIKGGVLVLDGKQDYEIDNMEEIEISEGTHSLEVTGDNIEAYTTSFTVGAGENYNLDLSQIQGKTGGLIINTNVDSYTLYINSKQEAIEDAYILNYGTYNIKIEKEGYDTFEKSVTINSDTVTLDAPLNKTVKVVSMGSLYVESTPSGSDVYVDGTYLGVTPLTTRVMSNESYAVQVKAPDYEDSEVQNVYVADDSEIKCTFNLNPLPQDEPELPPIEVSPVTE